MKSFRFIQLVTVSILISASVEARQDSPEKLYVETTRFATPLVEKWASEYEKVNPEIEIVLSSDKSADNTADLRLMSFVNNESVTTDKPQFYTGRYALLPVSNQDNPLLDELNKKRLNSHRLKELFFENNDFEEDAAASSKKSKKEVTIYSGNNADSFAASFAAHFGFSPVELKGRKISGDDIYLIHAVQHDHEGVTFNNLSYLFDTQTRQLKDGLALIPLDLKKDQRDVLEEANVDKTIALLENETIPLIPVENFGFISQNENPQAIKFLVWILNEGQKYNQAHGFLQVEREVLTSQLKKIEYLPLTALTD